MPRSSGLGKGLAALLPEERPAGWQDVPVHAIERNPHQPRRQLEGLDELAASIREHGVLQPVLVSALPRTGGDAQRYRLIAGERRLHAATIAGLPTVPAIVKEVSEQQLVELALIENIQREDLNALEEAEAYRHLIEEFGMTQEEVATRVGKSRAAITNVVRLLKAAPAVQEALWRGEISEGHARAILGAGDIASQERLLLIVRTRGCTVRQTEDLARRFIGPALEVLPSPAPEPARDPETERVEHTLRSALGTKVRLDRNRRGGRLTIFFSTDQELDDLYQRLVGG